MSRGYRMHSRKLNAASHASIQFDKLLNENSNRPTASKSSGTLGKWGVISCTSIRSATIKGRKEELLNAKRKRVAEYTNRNAKLPIPPAEDPFSFDTDPNDKSKTKGKNFPEPIGTPVKPVIKPKKFFKSRNADPAPKEDAAPVFPGSNRTGGATYGGKKYAKEPPAGGEAASVGSKKFFTSKKLSAETAVCEQTEAMNLSSPTKSPSPVKSPSPTKSASPTKSPSPTKTPSPSKAENKPPIVLRIFKGTSHLVGNENDKKSTILPPATTKPASAADSTTTRSVRSTRSTRNYSEMDDDLQLRSSIESKKPSRSPSNTHSELPKKSKRTRSSEAKDASASFVKDAVIPTTDSATDEALDGLDSNTNVEDTVNTGAVSNPIDCNPGNETASSTNSTLPNVSQDEATLAAHLPSGISKDSKEAAADSVKDTETEEQLLKANELLASTYVDFNSAAEQLLKPKLNAVAGPEATEKTNWFSDSEDDSSSMNDQLATAAVPNVTDSVKVDVARKDEFEEAILENPVVRTSSPATKKGSIFKSRSMLTGGNKKRLALYKHKWSDNDKPGDKAGAAGKPGASQPGNVYAELDEEFEPTKLTRVTSWPMTEADSLDLDEAEAITSVKCTKKAKGFYTVVRNVKKAHQIQESGEFQEFNDDVEYILDALQDTFPIGTRCLSAITLASKCMAPAFRMHVRAHGTVAKFFRALHDATKDQSLGLCTATVMFVLSQDRLNMDLDRHSLELMLNLLESDVSHRDALDDCGLTDNQLHKNKTKVRELCAEIQSQGHAKHLNLDNITVGHLAMETLLSLTSRRAGEWFKEELRELGGLEHIVKTICECCRQVDDYVVEWTDPLLDKLRKVDRCLRVLENVTCQNEENQTYLLKYSDGVLLDTLVKLFRQCDSEMPLYPVTDPADKDSTGTVIREVMLATLKVLINLTHDFNNKSYGSALAGERKGIIDASLHLLLQVPDYVPEEKKFDMLVLALILLINLVEHCQPNRKILFDAKAPPDPENVFDSNDKSAVQALIALFHQHEEHARNEELKTDAILDGKKDAEQPEVAEKPKSQEEFIEETVAKLLQKAGRHMEHTLIGAYVGLLLGYLIMDNHDYETCVRQGFPDKTFKTMVEVLQKVYNFMNLTASGVGVSRGIAQTDRVIKFMSKSDKLTAVALEDANSTETLDGTLDDSFS